MQNEELDDTVKLVAEQLPFPATLDADMGGTFTLQIDLGGRGGIYDPHDKAGIDPGPGEVWWIDIAAGERQIMSTLTIKSAPNDVANWIAKEALKAESPAAIKAVAGMGTNTPMHTAPTTTMPRAVAGGIEQSGEASLER